MRRGALARDQFSQSRSERFELLWVEVAAGGIEDAIGAELVGVTQIPGQRGHAEIASCNHRCEASSSDRSRARVIAAPSAHAKKPGQAGLAEQTAGLGLGGRRRRCHPRGYTSASARAYASTSGG